MDKLLDKLVIFLFCLIFYLQNTNDLFVIVPVIIAITCSALNSIWDNTYLRLTILAIYLLTCFYQTTFLFFAPLIVYDIIWSRWQYIVLLTGLPLALNTHQIPPITCLLIILLIALTWLMKHRTESVEKIRQEYIELRDSAKEFSLQLEGKNQELMERQDYEINLATLQERNRIAREIHDNVGHLLSSSILQIGALMARCQDETIRGSLETLKDTLSQGMNSIRDNIHDLHDESMDLYNETYKLTDQFHFCPVSLDYDIDSNPDKKIKYAFLAIMKEALSNIMKHSDASQVHITLREHPAMYQLIVRDNGRQKDVKPGEGIGLKNIVDRVNHLGGKINISDDNGFIVFISIPREGSYENRNCG